MCRQHFTMSINIHTLTVRLLEQLFKIFQIMSAYQNPRAFTYSDINFRNFRISIRRGIRLIKKSHSLHPALSDIQHQRNKLLGRNIRARYFCKGIFYHRIYVMILKSEI